MLKATEATDSPYPPRISFSLKAKDLDPDQIKNILGLIPDRSFKRGDKKHEDEPKRQYGYWRIDSAEHIESSDIKLHFEWLLNIIEPKQKEVLKLLNDKSIDAKIHCFWILPAPHSILIFEPEILNQISQLGIRLELSIYDSDYA
jgi:hypothetical protein